VGTYWQEMAAKQLGCSGGIADLLKVISEEKDASKVYVLFCGEPDASGESWCPDCVKAEPVVEECVKKITDPSVVFIMCSVGDKPTWKDRNNEFRTNSKTSLKAVPTLLLWGSPKRLVEDECANKDLVEMFFEED